MWCFTHAILGLCPSCTVWIINLRFPGLKRTNFSTTSPEPPAHTNEEESKLKTKCNMTVTISLIGIVIPSIRLRFLVFTKKEHQTQTSSRVLQKDTGELTNTQPEHPKQNVRDHEPWDRVSFLLKNGNKP